VAPYLTRLWPQLEEGGLRDSIEMGVHRAAEALRETCSERPFPLHYWDFSQWGNNGELLAPIFDAYWLT